MNIETPVVTVEASSRTARPADPRQRGDAARRRTQAALGAAALAFVAAVLMAVSPANASRGDYRWPSARSTTPVPQLEAEAQTLFAPLLLSRHTPARLSVDAPCQLVRASVPASGERFLILATANQPERFEALWLVVENEELKFGVGDTLLAEEEWPGLALNDPECSVSAGFRGDEWRLAVGGTELGRGLMTAPMVTGLFTQLRQSIQGQPGLSVSVVTEVAGSSPSLRQLVATALAVAAGVVALVLLTRRPVSRGRSRRLGRTSIVAAGSLRLAVRRLAWTDAVVVISLGAWWFFGPTLFDDGWVLETVLNSPADGTFSTYYDLFDVQYPLSFPLFTIHHVTSRVGTSLLWMRLPVLAVGLATWTLLRVYLAGLRSHPTVGPRGARAALGAAFLLFWFAWMNTLRPEPMVALLSVVAVVAIKRFCRTTGVGALATAALAASIAISLHPVGVITVAPLIASSPIIWRWARERGAGGFYALATVGLVAAALLVLLVLADSDLSRWRESRQLFADGPDHGYSWRDELRRYEYVFMTLGPYGPVVRRATVLFPLVAVALFVTRPERSRHRFSFDLPVLSLMLGAVLMLLTPSKWPWQLGALGGFAALAIATELHRLALEPQGSESRNRRSLLVVGSALAVSVIAWRGSADFTPFGLLEVDFGQGGSDFLGLDLSSPIPWLVLICAALIACAIVARGRERLRARSVVDRWLALAGTWTVPVAAGVVVVTTLSLFVADAFARAPGWSLPRQHFADLTGQTCGLADDVGVAVPTHGQPLEPDLEPADDQAVAAALPEVATGETLDFTDNGSPADPFGGALGTRWGSRITGDENRGVFFSPWFVVERSATSEGTGGSGLALFTAGRPVSTNNALLVQFGRRDEQEIETLGVELVAAQDTDVTWQASALNPPPGTDRMRVIAVDASQGIGGWLAFTAPRVVRYQPLDRMLGSPGATALVSQPLRFYFPCVTGPRIAGGVAEAPDFLVGAGGAKTSPLAGAADLYPQQRLLTRTSDGTSLGDLSLYGIDKQYAPGVPVPLAS